MDYLSLVSFTFKDGQVVRASQGGVLGGVPEGITCQDCGELLRRDEELWQATDLVMVALPTRVRDALTDGTLFWER